MVSLYNNHLNGLLADEMGLGKTVQVGGGGGGGQPAGPGRRQLAGDSGRGVGSHGTPARPACPLSHRRDLLRPLPTVRPCCLSLPCLPCSACPS